MKRQLFLTLTLTALVLALGFACEYGSLQISTDFQADMLAIGLSLADQNWDAALEQTQNLHAVWQKKSRLVQLWVNHSDIDNCSESLIALRAAVITQDFSAAMTAYGTCVENFGHLHHRDAFTLRNIL